MAWLRQGETSPLARRPGALAAHPAPDRQALLRWKDAHAAWQGARYEQKYGRQATDDCTHDASLRSIPIDHGESKGGFDGPYFDDATAAARVCSSRLQQIRQQQAAEQPGSRSIL